MQRFFPVWQFRIITHKTDQTIPVSSVLEPSRRNNKEALDRIADSLRTSYADSVYQLKRIQVVGGASPEGSIPLNRRLSVKRANVLFNYLSRYGELPDSLKTNVFLGRDWNGLIRLVSYDPELPVRARAQAVQWKALAWER